MSLTAAALLALSLAQARPAPTVPPRPAGGATTSPAAAGAPATPRAPAPAPLATPAPEPALPEFGVTFDAAFPQGLAVSFAYRPLPFIRLWAGPAWNYSAFGLQGGVGLVLVRWAVTPVLSLEAGRYLSTDISPLLNRAGDIPSEMSPLLRDVRYAYGAAHLGLEFGSQRGFNFFVRLGIARLAIRTTGSGEVINNEGTADETTVVFVNPRFRGTTPSLKLGCTYWF